MQCITPCSASRHEVHHAMQCRVHSIFHHSAGMTRQQPIVAQTQWHSAGSMPSCRCALEMAMLKNQLPSPFAGSYSLSSVPSYPSSPLLLSAPLRLCVVVRVLRRCLQPRRGHRGEGGGGAGEEGKRGHTHTRALAPKCYRRE